MRKKNSSLRGSVRLALGLAASAAVFVALPAIGAQKERPGAGLAPRRVDPAKAAAKAGSSKGAEKATTQPTVSSLIEDRAARKLLEAGNARMELNQTREGLELYQQVVERYPRSAVRFEAFGAMGKYHLEKAKDAAKALAYFERAADETNESPEIRGNAMLMVGRCFYEQQKYPQAFASLRQVIATYPGTDYSNQAYFYIGNAHYKLGAYNRAIEAFSRVGTAISETEQGKKQLEIGKRLFIRLSDQDLASLPEGAAITCTVSGSSGDKETVRVTRVGSATSTNYLGEIDTVLGAANAGDSTLQVSGNDTVTVSYVDSQTADKQVNVLRTQELKCVHNAIVDFMDGAFRDPLKAVVVGKTAYVRVIDYDRDITPGADNVTVKIIAKRQIVKDKPLHVETPVEPPKDDKSKKDKKKPAVEVPLDPVPVEEDKPEFKVVDEVTVKLTERPKAPIEGGRTPGEGQTMVHTGVFGGQVPVLPDEPVAGDAALQVQNGDILEIHYTDEINTTGKAVEVVSACTAVPGSLGEVKIANPDIKDQQLELQTHLKKAEALTNIGRIYKQLGLKEQADAQFNNGVAQCEALAARAKNLGGDVLEQMYVRMMKLYIELDQLDKAASMCLALEREFPNSQFVDEALLGLGETSMKKKEYDKAIAVFKRVLELPLTQRKADALFNIGVCQEELAKPKAADPKPNQAMTEAAFTSFQAVFQQYPSSGVAGEAVGRIADYYMNQKSYDRAISTLQQALDEYPDAQFIDRVLYDYGRCLFRVYQAEKNKAKLDEAMSKFRQLMSEYPQSKLAAKAKQLIPALEKMRANEG